MNPIILNAIINKSQSCQVQLGADESIKNASVPAFVIMFYQAQMHAAIMQLWQKFGETIHEQAEKANEDHRAHEKQSQEKIGIERALEFAVVRQAGHFRFLSSKHSVDLKI